LAGDAMFRVQFFSGFVSKMRTRRAGSAYGSGRSSTALAMLKTAVPAPMPMARVAMITGNHRVIG